MSDDPQINRYDQRNIDTLEMVYGKGYLSAGGDEEVKRIFNGIDTKGKRVLDLGCGLGGATVVMIKYLNTAEVIAYDIDTEVLSKAKTLVEENGIADRVNLIKGNPGPLQFKDQGFDIVYTTAVSCHIKELKPFFDEIHRVLKPSGWLIGCEWLKRKDNQAFKVWDNMLRERGLNFYFVSPTSFHEALEHSGFANIQLLDRTQVFTEYSAQAQLRVMNELKPDLLTTLGSEGYEAFLNWTTVRYETLQNRGMYQQYFRGQK